MKLSDIFDLLIEDMIETIASKQEISLMKANKEDTKQFSNANELLTYLADNISSTYIQWLANQYQKQLFSIPDIPKMKELVDNFTKLKIKLKKSDINNYSIPELTSALDVVLPEAIKNV